MSANEEADQAALAPKGPWLMPNEVDLTALLPTNDLLLVRRLPDEVETVSPGGIVIPAFGEDKDEHKDTPLRGVVLAAGRGRRPKLSSAGQEVVNALRACVEAISRFTDPALHKALVDGSIAALAAQSVNPDRIPMDVCVGDTVIFSKWGHQVFRINGEDLLVLAEDSVMGVIERG
jgi:co-chaperonin GroES (HSP10)